MRGGIGVSLCWLAVALAVAALPVVSRGTAAEPAEVPAAAASSSSLGDRARELEQLRASIAKLQGRLEGVRRQVDSARDRLATLEVELELQQQRVAEAVAAGALAAERTATLEAGVAELGRRLEEMRENLRARVVALHRLGRTAYLRMLLTVETKENLLPAIRQLRFFARRDKALIDTWVETKARLDLERRDLAIERARVAEWLESETSRRDRLDQLRAEQVRLVSRARREELALAQESTDLLDKAKKLSSFLDFLYGRSTAPLSGQLMQSFKGVLDWPIQGPVSVPFGPRKDPRYGTLTPHNGIEIETPSGTMVRAVYPGRVVFAAPFQGYGPTVIMVHAGRVFSLYAGLSATQVREGDVVSLGAEVGRSSERLYFEIRDRNEPVDPKFWLR